MSEQTVPTMRYHPNEPSRLLETPEDLAALGPEWLDHPYSDEERAAWQAQQEAPTDMGQTPPPPRKR